MDQRRRHSFTECNSSGAQTQQDGGAADRVMELIKQNAKSIKYVYRNDVMHAARDLSSNKATRQFCMGIDKRMNAV